MSNYISIIEDYIKLPETNYAIMINGDWGNGKTYFLLNEVFPKLKKEMNKEPIYISLNGVSSVNDVSKQIFYETSFLSDPRLKELRESKLGKYTSVLLKTVHNAASLMGKAGGIEHTTEFDKLIAINDNVVLCFDDLERCKINITEILGYINNFVEHDNTKVIILGNEKEIKDHNLDMNTELKYIAAKLLQEKAENNNSATKSAIESQVEDIEQFAIKLFGEQRQYDLIKEKLIGKTILYQPEFDLIIDTLIEVFEKDEPAYYRFLKQHKQFISDIHNKSERRNIRITRNALDDFIKVFKSLDKGELQYEVNLNKIKTTFFTTLMIINVRHKEGKVNEQVLMHTASEGLKYFISLYKKSDLAFYLDFADVSGQKLFHSQAVAKYLVSNVLDKEMLIEDAKEIIKLWYTEEQHKKAIDKLYNDYLDMEDDDFQSCLSEVIEEIKTGRMSIIKYPKMFMHLQELYDIEMTSIDIDEIMNIFKEGIEKIKLESDFSEKLERHFPHVSSPTEQYVEVLKKVNDKITEAQSGWLKQRVDEIINYLPDEADRFIKEYFELSKSNANEGILQYVDIEVFCNKLRILNNEKFNQIRYELYLVYRDHNLNYFNKNDYQSLLEFKVRLEQDIVSLSGAKRVMYKHLISEIGKWTE